MQKTCREKKRVRERKREGGRDGRRRDGKKKAAPPATKLTASRLDIWPFVIREVPDSVPHKSQLRIIILPGVDSTMSDQLKSSYVIFFNPPLPPSLPPPSCSPVNIAAKITLQFCACLPLNCLPSKHNLLWQYIRWYVS